LPQAKERGLKERQLKVCIFGGGAIGGYIAGHLARSGLCDVSLVARGAQLEAIKKNGLRVVASHGEFSVPVRATADTNDLGAQDYVFLTLKSHQLDNALPQLAPLMTPATTVIPPTTGIPYYFFYGQPGPYADRRLTRLDPGNRQWEAIPPRQALGCVYWIGAHMIAPGVVGQDGQNAGMPVGELDGSASPRVSALSQLLTDSGIPARVRDNIRGDIWVKFVNSLCWNPMAVLTMARMGEMGEAEGLVAIVERTMEEADAVGSKLGLKIPSAPAKRIATTLTAPMHKMSMLQDFESGRELELPVLEQSIRAMSEIAMVPTPTLDMVLAMARLRAGTAMKARTKIDPQGT
jgi:2-dehydropantoate 2-reductase